MTTKDKHPKTSCEAIVSNRAIRIAPSGIRKFFDLLSGMEGVISLGVGEPDYTPTYPRIRYQLHRKRDDDVHLEFQHGN
jgi:aminotransferase